MVNARILWKWVYIQFIFLIKMLWMLLTCQMTITSGSCLAQRVSIELIPRIAVESDVGIWLDLTRIQLSSHHFWKDHPQVSSSIACTQLNTVDILFWSTNICTNYSRPSRFSITLRGWTSGEQLTQVPIAVKHVALCLPQVQIYSANKRRDQQTKPSLKLTTIFYRFITFL